MNTTTDATTTGAMLLAVLSRYAEELPPLLRAAAADEPDAVHQARILVRRTRGVLAAGRDSFAPGSADAVRDALEPVGADLGQARDLEVRIGQAEAQVAAGADADVVDRLMVRERERYRAAHDVFVQEIDADAVVAALAAFVADPPFGGDAEQPAAHGLGRAIRHEVRRVGRARRAVLGDLDSLHRLRRTTRRLRYVAEAFTEEPARVFDGDVVALAEASKRVQDVLGDHRDAALFALEVRRAETEASRSGPPSPDYARIAAEAFATAAGLIEELPAAIDDLRERMGAVD